MLFSPAPQEKSIRIRKNFNFRCFSRQLLKKKASEFAKISFSDAFRASLTRKKHQNSQKSQFPMLFSPALQEKSIGFRIILEFRCFHCVLCTHKTDNRESLAVFIHTLQKLYKDAVAFPL